MVCLFACFGSSKPKKKSKSKPKPKDEAPVSHNEEESTVQFQRQRNLISKTGHSSFYSSEPEPKPEPEKRNNSSNNNNKPEVDVSVSLNITTTVTEEVSFASKHEHEHKYASESDSVVSNNDEDEERVNSAKFIHTIESSSSSQVEDFAIPPFHSYNNSRGSDRDRGADNDDEDRQLLHKYDEFGMVESKTVPVFTDEVDTFINMPHENPTAFKGNAVENFPRPQSNAVKLNPTTPHKENLSLQPLLCPSQSTLHQDEMATLSSEITTPIRNRNGNTTASSSLNSKLQESSSPRSHEDDTSISDLKQISSSPTIEMQMPIIGTYWSHTLTDKDRDYSPSSFKGIPNTTSKYREDKTVKWHSTPFETRLERALKRGVAKA